MLKIYVILLTALLLGALFLHLLPRLGKVGNTVSDFFCRAPGVDFALGYFMLIPFLVAIPLLGLQGFVVAFLAELSSLFVWIIAHELTHFRHKQRGKIAFTLSGLFGWWRNHLAVWITALAIPVFWMVRFAEIIVYPPLTLLVNLPKYDSKEWVNVSRQKFEGLIGYDLIWCLYCDWMTGVWSLGTEMLRNVESFWCPIRFYSEKKCENCRQDFPDIDGGWVSADGTVEDVTKVLKEKYNATQDSAWFGHPNRKNQG